MLARLASPVLSAVRVDGAHVLREDGGIACVVESGDVDVGALDGSRQAVAVAAFARLCRTLDGPLQIVVQIRRRREHATAPLHDSASLTETLRDASARHRERILAERPAFRRRILFVPSATTVDDADRGARLVLDALHTAGVGGDVLRDGDLRQCLGDALVPPP